LANTNGSSTTPPIGLEFKKPSFDCDPHPSTSQESMGGVFNELKGTSPRSSPRTSPRIARKRMLSTIKESFSETKEDEEKVAAELNRLQQLKESAPQKHLVIPLIQVDEVCDPVDSSEEDINANETEVVVVTKPPTNDDFETLPPLTVVNDNGNYQNIATQLTVGKKLAEDKQEPKQPPEPKPRQHVPPPPVPKPRIKKKTKENRVLIQKLKDGGFITTKKVEDIMLQVNRANYTSPSTFQQVNQSEPIGFGAFTDPPRVDGKVLEILVQQIKPGFKVLEIGCELVT